MGRLLGQRLLDRLFIEEADTELTSGPAHAAILFPKQFRLERACELWLCPEDWFLHSPVTLNTLDIVSYALQS